MLQQTKKAYFAGGCFWAKTVWETVLGPCLEFSEYLEENSDKVYCRCKRKRVNLQVYV